MAMPFLPAAHGQILSGGAAVPFATNGGVGENIKVNSSGYGVIADYHNGQVIGFRPDGSTYTAISSTELIPYLIQLGPGAGTPEAAAIDNQGNIYVALPNNVLKKSPSGQKTLYDMGTEAQWQYACSGNPYCYALPPTDMAVDAAGDMYVSFGAPSTVVEVPAGGGAPIQLNSSLGFSTTIYGIAVDSRGVVYVCDPGQGIIQMLFPNSNGYTQTLSLNGVDMSNIESVAVDSQDNIYIGGWTQGFNRIVRVSADFSTVADLQMGQHDGVWGLGIGPNDDLYLLTPPPSYNDSGYPTINVVRMPTRQIDFGSVTAPASPTYQNKTLTFTYPFGVPASGPAFVSNAPGSADFQATNWNCVAGPPASCTLTLGASPAAAGLRTGTLLIPGRSPGVWADAIPLHVNGVAPTPLVETNLYYTYSAQGQTYMQPGQVTPLGNGSVMYANTPGNDILTATSSTATPTALNLSSPATDPNHATASPTLSGPQGLAVDPMNDVFIADTGNNRVVVYQPGDGRRLATGSYYVYNLPTPGYTLSSPTYLALDGSGNLFINDQGNDRILEVSCAGLNTSNCSPQVSVAVSGIQDMQGIALDAAGNLYVADPQSAAVFKVTPGGETLTKLNASGVLFEQPYGVAVDAAGTVYVADIGQQVGNGLIAVTAAGVGAAVANPLWWTLPINVSIDAQGDLFLSMSQSLMELPRTAGALMYATAAVNTTSGDSPKSFTVGNEGNGNLSLAGLSFPADFPESTSGTTCTNTTTLTPTQSCAVAVNFTPLSAATLNENVTLTENGSNLAGAAQQVAVIGTGVQGGQSQTITFTPRSACVCYTYSTSGGYFEASSSSGLPVTVTVLSGPADFNGGTSANFNGGLGTFSVRGAGSGMFVATQAGSSIYGPAAPVYLSYTISPLGLTIRNYTVTQQYGAASPTLTYLLTGVINGDKVSLAIAGGIGPATPVGSATVNFGLTGVNAGNYVLQAGYQTGTATVTPAPLTIAATDGYQLAGTTPGNFGFGITGLVNGDLPSVVTGAPAITTTAMAASAAGSYPIVPAAGTLAAANYSFSTFENGVLNIFAPINLGAANVKSLVSQKFTFPAGPAGTVATAQMLNMGAPTGALVAGGFGCTFSATGSCSVNLSFVAANAGAAYGALELFDNATPANLLVSIPVMATGSGPQIAYNGAPQTTLGSNFGHATGVAVDGLGNVYVADSNKETVTKIAPGGTQTPVGSGWQAPSSVAIDGAGNVFVLDLGQQAMVKVTPAGVQSTIGLTTPLMGPTPALAIDGAGNLYIADPVAPAAYKLTQAGVQTTIGSGFQKPSDVAVDGAGNVFVADYSAGSVSKVTPGGVQTTIASALSNPECLTLDAAGTVYVFEENGAASALLAIGPSGQTTALPELAGATGTQDIELDAAGNLYAANLASVLKYDRVDAPALQFAATPAGLTSTDSPRTIGLQNVGTAALNFSALSYPADFPEAAGVATECTASSVLQAAGACTMTIDFAPRSSTISGASNLLSETIGVTTNNLNATAAAQTLALTGAVLDSPAITSPATGTLTVSQTGTITVTAVNTTALSETGALPSGVSFKNNGTTATISGMPAAGTVGSYPITLTATNGVGPNGTQSFTLIVAQPPAITSSNETYFTAGVQGSFLVTASGWPLPALSEAGGLPGGMQFTDNGNGTATLAGTPAAGAGGTYLLTITAANGGAPNGTQSLTLDVGPTALTVTTAADDAAGVAANCPVTGPTGSAGMNCSLRDALAESAAIGGAAIRFSDSVFYGGNSAAQNTITLGGGGTLVVAANTYVIGETELGPSGAFSTVVTVNGNSAYTVFNVAVGGAGSSLNGLTITGGAGTVTGAPSMLAGGGVLNYGTLSVNNCIVTGNMVDGAGQGAIKGAGGGIANFGTLTVSGSLISSNAATGNDSAGGGIYSNGTLTVTGSTIENNTATRDSGAAHSLGVIGGGLYAAMRLTAIESTFTGNQADATQQGVGGGIYVDQATATSINNDTIYGNTASSSGGVNGPGSYNSIISGNAGGDTGANFVDAGGNEISVSGINLGSLGLSYGFLPVMVPMTGSPAICGGLVSNIVAGTTDDERGVPRTTAYGSTACVDSGAVQTHYGLAFTTNVPGTAMVGTAISPALVVQLTEFFSYVSGTGTVTMSDAASVIGGTKTANLSAGAATFSNLVPSAGATGDVLTATMAVATGFNISAASLPANVTQLAQTINWPAIGANQNAGTPFHLGATATSGLTVAFASTTPTVCSVSAMTANMLSSGTCTIQATQAGNAAYAAAVPVSQSTLVHHIDQTITFPAIGSQPAGTSLALAGSTTSGLPIVYASTTPAVCTVSGKTASLLIPGSCTIQATQPGNGEYNPAALVSQSFSVTLASQTINWPAIGANQNAGTPFHLGATATSGLTVAFASTTPTVCTVSGTTANMLTAGSCTIQAAQAGNATYAAATPVSQSTLVHHINQTITFPSVPAQKAGASVALSATSDSGLAVAFASTTTSVCTVSGTTASLLTAGTCTLQASQAGNGEYNPATLVSQSFSVTLVSQTISWPAVSANQNAATSFVLSATASSGLAVAFASTTPTICTVSGTNASLLISGTCTLQATQAGNSVYAAAPPVSQSVLVHHIYQTITFPTIAAQSAKTSAALAASSNSGLAVTFASTTPTVCTVSGSTASLLIAGTCTVQASQAGNGVYNPASVSQSFTVTLAGQSITWPAVAANQNAATSFTLSATATSGLAVAFSSTTPTICTVSGTTASLLISGTCTLQATQAGNATYAAATPVSQSTLVHHVNQTITFPAIAAQKAGTSVGLSATSTSGLAVAFASTTPAVCTVSGNMASLLIAGNCTIQASQGGNGVYNPATAVSQSFSVAAH